MAQLDLGLVADNAHVNAAGKFYILGEFRYIFAPTVPVQLAHFTVALQWLADVVEVRNKANTIEIEVVDQDGKPILPRSPKLALQFGEVGPAARGRAQAQLVLNMNGLVLPAYGDYAIHFFLNEVSSGKVVFHVAPPPPPPKP